MDINVETFSDREVVFTWRTGAYPQSAPEAWDALWTWIHNKGHMEQVKRMIGFGLDNPAVTAADQCRYEACIELHSGAVADDDAGIGVQTLPGGTYAVYRMVGAYSQMPECFQTLRNDVLPEKGLTIDPFRPFLEIYVSGNVPEDERQTDLCIPVET